MREVDEKRRLPEEGERWRARGLCDPAGAGRRKRGERGGEDGWEEERGGGGHRKTATWRFLSVE